MAIQNKVKANSKNYGYEKILLLLEPFRE